jgi:hypothetical protein
MLLVKAMAHFVANRCHTPSSPVECSADWDCPITLITKPIGIPESLGTLP